MNREQAHHIAIDTLKKLIRIPSASREEGPAADLIQSLLEENGFNVHRKYNNVWTSIVQSEKLPFLLLNSHIDTIPPGEGWLTDPYEPVEDGDKITGLGSNDAGASLVSLMVVFMRSGREMKWPFNLVFVASAEEEISGKNGIGLILPELGKIALGVVGEPTAMKLAIAEKGLLVLDCTASGITGHAARKEGKNAIYMALQDIDWIRNYRFDRKSELTGEVSMQVTRISGGVKHNIVPGQCSFVVDVRTNDRYTNSEVLDVIRKNISGSVSARSTRLNASGIEPDHPIVESARQLNMDCIGSDTLSDQALMPFPTVKIGPGQSMRSHTANEFICKSEIINGIDAYMKLLNKYAELMNH